MKRITRKKHSPKEVVINQLSERIQSVYSGEKFNKAINSKFDMLNQDVDDEILEKLVRIAVESDKDLKVTIHFATWILNGRPESQNRKRSMDFIERVVSEFSILSSIKTKTLFQIWIEKKESGQEILPFITNQLEQLNVPDSAEKSQKLKPKQITSIIQIAAMWLYFKDQSFSNSLFDYLAKNSRNVDSSLSRKFVQDKIFLLGVDIIASKQRDSFAYHLTKINTEKESLDVKNNRLNSDINKLNIQLKSATDNIQSLSADLKSKKDQTINLESKITDLEDTIKNQVKKAKHAEIHHVDEKKNISAGASAKMSQIKRDIEDIISANKKSKSDIVADKLSTVLDIINKEL